MRVRACTCECECFGEPPAGAIGRVPLFGWSDPPKCFQKVCVCARVRAADLEHLPVLRVALHARAHGLVVLALLELGDALWEELAELRVQPRT